MTSHGNGQMMTRPGTPIVARDTTNLTSWQKGATAHCDTLRAKTMPSPCLRFRIVHVDGVALPPGMAGEATRC
jgi:hypothetical protein